MPTGTADSNPFLIGPGGGSGSSGGTPGGAGSSSGPGGVPDAGGGGSGGSAPPVIAGPTFGAGPALVGGCGLPTIRFYQSYLWKFIVTNLNLETITMLDRLASSRRVIKTLNDAMEIGLRVPSDNIRVNIPFVDGDPKVDEGTRLLVGFRKEGEGAWTCRAAGIIMQIHDGVDGDVMMTDVTAWDPWRYLDFLPVVNVDISGPPGAVVPTAGPIYWSSNSTGHGKPAGIVDYTVDEMIIDQLSFALSYYSDPLFDNGLFLDWGQTPYYNGTIETVQFPPTIPAYSTANSTMIGNMFREITGDPSNNGMGLCDIVIEPIYDPVNRPGIIGELSIYAKAGVQKDTSIMSWDVMPRTLTSLDRLKDGTQRSNNIQFADSRGGPPISLVSDATSAAKYKTYYKNRVFPSQGGRIELLENLAAQQLMLRANGVETITVSPTSERAKVPFLDYDIGDTIPIYSSDDFRKEVFAYYRVLQIPVSISDEATETVDSLTLFKTADINPETFPSGIISAPLGITTPAVIPRAVDGRTGPP